MPDRIDPPYSLSAVELVPVLGSDAVQTARASSRASLCWLVLASYGEVIEDATVRPNSLPKIEQFLATSCCSASQPIESFAESTQQACRQQSVEIAGMNA